ncbi:MAG: OmpA family protein, partial [Bacteroidota bacterium]
LPVKPIEGFKEITIKGRLVEKATNDPLSSYSISLIKFDDKGTVIEGYTDSNGYFEFTAPPERYDLLFEKVSKLGEVQLSDLDISGSQEVGSGFLVSDTRAFFDVGKYSLRPEVQVLLDDLAKAFQSGGEKIEIESHTDNTGNADVNLKLSKNRGYAARDYLLDKGISKADISVIWHGSEKPLADNSNPFGRQLNRRVDVRLIANTEVDFGSFYLVRPGTSLNMLARSMRISPQVIVDANKLSGSELVAYQPVRIKSNEAGEPDYNLVIPADIGSTRQFLYTVKSGESVSTIAEKFQVPEELIMEQNDLFSLRVDPGTVLIIYSAN